MYILCVYIYIYIKIYVLSPHKMEKKFKVIEKLINQGRL